MITEDNLIKMNKCSHLLPDTGGEVVRQCLDEIRRLRNSIIELSEINNIGYLKDRTLELIADE